MIARASRCAHCPYSIDDLMSRGLRTLRVTRTCESGVVVTAILDRDPEVKIEHVSRDAAEGLVRHEP